MGLFQPPPPDGTSYPDIPVADFVTAAVQAATGATQSSWWDDLINKWLHRIWDGVTFGITALAGGLDDVFAPIVQLLTSMQGLNQPGFFSMVAAILGDLLGMEFSADVIRESFQRRGRLGAMSTIGGNIYDTLRGEFDPSGGTAQQIASDAPARAFLGFLTEFAVRQGNVALFSELIPIEFNILGGLREYGELLARNLGLGRLARQALRPLMQIMVADPLMWQLNKTYRPKLLSEGQAVKAFKSGLIDRNELNRILSYQGYSDSAIEVLIADYSKPWHASQLMALYRSGAISETEAIGRLIDEGIPQATAGELWQSYLVDAAQTQEEAWLSALFREVRQGYLEIQPLTDAIDAAPLTPIEKKLYHDRAGLLVELPRKHLTESELERAFLGGIVDMTTVQDVWRRIGYSTASIQVLSLLLLQKQSSTNRTKSGHAAHKVITEAQAEAAYKAGIINLAQLQAYWHAMGYSPDDQAVLSALVQLKTPGPGETQFPGMTTP